MIVVEKKDTAFANGFADAGQFTIKASAKAFRILSDKIYKNNVLAIIRELSTNALDSHIANGNPTQKFDVHLPDRFNPTFSIRDYGTGLSHNNVMKVFTTYFESTKEDTNDAFGTLGLGSKSPFSYVGTYSVTSWFDGQKSTYVAYISDADTPSILFAGSEASDEQSGLEISFPVKNEDINRFAEEAVKVFRWFENCPNIKGRQIADNIAKYYVPDHMFNFKNWFITKPLISSYDYRYNITQHLHGLPGIFVLQGPILYPVDINRVTVPLSETLSNICAKSGIVFTVPNGTVNFAPSREELNYDKHTITTLNHVITTINNDMDEFVKKTLQNQTPYERYVSSTITLPERGIVIQPEYVSKVLGLKCVPELEEIKSGDFPSTEFKFFKIITGYKKPMSIQYDEYRSGVQPIRYQTRSYSSIILVKATGLKGASRVTEYILHKYEKKKNFFDKCKIDSGSFFLVLCKDEASLQKFKKRFIDHPIIEVTDKEIELVIPKKVVVRKKIGYAQFKKCDNYSSVLQYTKTNIEGDISNTSGYYLLTDNISCVKVGYDNLSKKLTEMKAAGYTNVPEIYQLMVSPRLFFSCGTQKLEPIATLTKPCYLFRIKDLEEVLKNKNLKPLGKFIEETALLVPSAIRTHKFDTAVMSPTYSYQSTKPEISFKNTGATMYNVAKVVIKRNLKFDSATENNHVYRFVMELVAKNQHNNDAISALYVMNRYFVDKVAVKCKNPELEYEEGIRTNIEFVEDKTMPKFDITGSEQMFRAVYKKICDTYGVSSLDSSVDINDYFDLKDEIKSLREQIEEMKYNTMNENTFGVPANQ